jgi:hypothetical protein
MKQIRFPDFDALVKAANLAGGLFIGASALAAAPAPAGAPDAGSAASFDAFRMVGNLNIFDSTRVGWVDDAPKVHVDTISFVGTMDYDKGRLAFFDSSERSFRKALHAGETIADFTVVRVDSGGVELTRDSKSIKLLMGQQLRRPPGGEWALAAGSVRAEPAAERQATAEAAPPPAGASDILLRLMAKRQQELKQ